MLEFPEYYLLTGRGCISGKSLCDIKGRKCEEIQKKIWALETIRENH